MSEQPKADVTLRVMTKADVPFGMRLKNIAGWNQLPADWERFLELEPRGCFVAIEDGQDVGTVTTTTYGKNLGWIGMVLVPPEKRRRGIGRALMLRALQYLHEQRIEVIGLDATPLGNKLYLTLNFHEDWPLERRQGRGRALSVRGVSGMKSTDLDTVTEFDAARFGVERPAVLRALYRDYPELCWVVRETGKLRGYIMMRPGLNAHQVGPWVASDPEAAEELFKTALNAVTAKPVFLDVAVPNVAAMEIVKKYGFELQRPFVRMYLGPSRYPCDVTQTYAICGVEKG